MPRASLSCIACIVEAVFLISARPAHSSRDPLLVIDLCLGLLVRRNQRRGLICYPCAYSWTMISQSPALWSISVRFEPSSCFVVCLRSFSFSFQLTTNSHLCASLIFVLLHPQVTISINHRYQPWPPPTMSQSGSTKKNVDHRTPMMRDLPNAFNPLTGRRYAYPRNVFNFAGLSHTAQRRRMAAWNTALDQGLVEYD